jgi:hypothetical protein
LDRVKVSLPADFGLDLEFGFGGLVKSLLKYDTKTIKLKTSNFVFERVYLILTVNTD